MNMKNTPPVPPDTRSAGIGQDKPPKAAEQDRTDGGSEFKEEPDASPQRPPAGPHAKPELTNRDATPGAGLLPDPDDTANAPDSASS